MHRRNGPTPRPGYTLVELLVVITIIVILVALTTAVVGKVRGMAQRTTAVSEISQLNSSVNGFKNDFGLLPPSHVVDVDSTGKPQVRRFQVPTNVNQPEFAVLKRMFPRWTPTTDAAGNMTAGAPAGAGAVLDCNQVMVYLLGGPNALTGTGEQGWDVAGPYAPATGAKTKKGPYFDFPANRLVSGPNNIPWFTDPWGTPYAFFTSNGSQYDPRVPFPWMSSTQASFGWSGSPIAVADPAYVRGNDATPYLTVHPFQSNGRWLNPNSVQIVTAGEGKFTINGVTSRRFGMGSPISGSPPTQQSWTPGMGDYMEGAIGADDLANFNAGKQLGTQGD